MTVVIVTGGIDLSVGSVYALAAILCTKVLDVHNGFGKGAILAIVLAIGAAPLIGLLQGLLIARVGLPPFIVTLAGLYGIRVLRLDRGAGLGAAVGDGGWRSRRPAADLGGP